MKEGFQVTQAEKRDALNAIQRATNDELEKRLAEILAFEQRCRLLAGIGPEDGLPFFVSRLAGWWSSAIMLELDLRAHSIY